MRRDERISARAQLVSAKNSDRSKGKAPPPPAAAVTNVPLALRVPNAPARFVGRAEVLRRARDLLRRGPLVVITGDAGIGKSALISWLLHEQLADRARSSVYVSLRGADPDEHPALVVARAIARAAGARDVEWSEVLGNADALGALAIDLAGDRWVVLDDLGSAPARDVADLLRRIARYARQNKWIAAVPTAPTEGDLIDHILPLGPMPDAEMRLLARSLAPSMSAAEVAALVAKAAGSPQRLRQILAGGPAVETRSDPSAEDAAFLGTLALISIPIPEAILARIAPASPAALEALERARWIERSREGVIVPERARSLVPLPSIDDRRARAALAGAALCAAEDPALRVEGVRLLLAAGLPDETARVLARIGEDLIATGYAARLQRLLEDAPHAALDVWRLRVAADLGDTSVLSSVRPPSSDAIEARYQWARMLVGMRRFDEAIAIAARVQAEAEIASDRGLAFDAGLLRAQVIGNRDSMRECVALLDALAPPDASAAAQRDGFAAMALAIDGRLDEALARGEALRVGLDALPAPVRRRVGYRLSQAYNHAGRPRDAAQILDTLLADGHGSVRLITDRTMRFARACLSLDAGHIEAALAALVQLEPYVARMSLLGVHFDIARAVGHFAEGALDQVDRLLDGVIARDPGPHVMAEAESLATRVRVLRRDAGSTSPPAQLASVFGETYAIARAELDLRAGRVAPAEVIAATAKDPENPEVQLAARTLRACARLLAGDAPAAAREAGATAEAAREHGYGVRAAEAKQCQCDALLVAGQWDALAHGAHELAALAAAMPSPRFDAAARFFRLAAARGPLDAAALEALAQHAAAPDIALRTRALLGAPVTVDAIDRAVLAALARSGKRAPETILHPALDPSWRPGWGLDEAARHVWLPNGTRVDFARQAVEWRILTSLAASGGSATKEALTLIVWGEREYHPLRHDNRLQAAVRKLRLAIEDDPGTPTRIVTTDDGYALFGVVRRLRADADFLRTDNIPE